MSRVQTRGQNNAEFPIFRLLLLKKNVPEPSSMLAKTMRINSYSNMPFFTHQLLETLLTVSNGVFPVTVKRSYVQLTDGSSAPVQHGPRVSQVDSSESSPNYSATMPPLSDGIEL